jgi:glutamate--cysteine ligase
MRRSGRSDLTTDDLRSYFLSDIKKPKEFSVGIEWEKLGIDRITGAAIPYHGPRGVKAIFEALIRKYHWKPIFGLKGEPIALNRGKSMLTLEPGGQIELSGQKAYKMADNERELKAHLSEMRSVSEPLGIIWLGFGAQPFSTRDQMGWVPKDRYAIMRRVLRGRGSKTFSMMKETASIQVSLDFSSEADALQKFRLAMCLSPYLAALFANSFLELGKRSRYLSRRADIWHHTDAARTGILWRALDSAFSLDDYIEYALHVPMFFIKRADKWVLVRGHNFKTYMQSGYRGHKATLEDWNLHLTTIFTEARLKSYIEIRSIDCQTAAMGLAAATFLKVLFYDPIALKKALALLSAIAIPEHMEIYYLAPLKALRSRTRKTRSLDVVRELHRLATHGADAAEKKYLEPLAKLIKLGLSPAQLFIKENGIPKKKQDLIAALEKNYSL